MTKVFYIVVIAIMIFLGLTFTYMNNQMVEINYLSFSRQVHLSLLLLVILVIGVVMGFLANLFSAMKTRRNLSNAKRELKNLQSGNL